MLHRLQFCTLLLLLLSAGCGRTAPQATPNTAPPLVDKFISVHVPGISQPDIYQANQVELPGETMVVGVVVNEQARAYMVDAMDVSQGGKIILGEDESALARHVVNDLVDGIPISVTYCETTDCSTVFTDAGSQPLELCVGGWSGDSMLLRYQNSTFAQDQSAPPLPRFPHQVMAWDEWRNTYPQTQIYLGDFAERYVTGAG